jgi:hypothetical protein
VRSRIGELRSFLDGRKAMMEHMTLPLVSALSATTSISSEWTYPLSDSFTDSGDHVLLSCRRTWIRRRFGHIRDIRQDRLPLSSAHGRDSESLP